jgi:hypothetical protein
MSIKNKTMKIITDYSKITFGLLFVLTTTLIIPIDLFNYGSHTNHVFARKLTTQERYNSGYKDGSRDCLKGNNVVSNYKESSSYINHSQLYQQGYDQAVKDCSNNNDQAQSQSTPYTSGSNGGDQSNTGPDTSGSNGGDQSNTGPDTSGSSNSGTTGIDWEGLCNQYHSNLLFSLKAPCSTYAHGTQLTPAGNQALFCLGGGAIATLISIVGISNPLLAGSLKLAQTQGEKLCP